MLQLFKIFNLAIPHRSFQNDKR